MVHLIRSLITLTAVSLSICALADAEFQEPQERTAALSEIRDGTVASFYIDCQLREISAASASGTSIRCEDLIQNYFSAFPTSIQRATSFNDALVRVTMTDEKLPNGQIRVSLSFSSRPNLSVTDFAITTALEPGMDRTTIVNQLVINLQKGVNLHLKILASTESDGKIMAVHEPLGKARRENTSKLATGPMYFDLSLNGNSFSQQNQGAKTSVATGMGSFTANHSTPKTRVMAMVNGNYQSTTVPGAGGSQVSADNFNRSLMVIGAYSFTKHWSVALIGERKANPGSNIENSQAGLAGVEWTLVPFRVDEDKELRFQIGAGPGKFKLGSPNGRGNLEEEYAIVMAGVRFYWMLLESRITLNANAGAQTFATHPGYESYSGGLNFSFQITKALRVNSGANYIYTARSLTYPGSPDFSNPLKTAFLSGGEGSALQFTLGGGLTLGNGLLHIRDRRWR